MTEFKFNTRIVELMEEHDIKSDALAAIIGVSRQAVMAWRNNGKSLALSNIIKVADYFNISIDYLVGHDDNYTTIQSAVCVSFYPRLRELMKIKGITRYRITHDSKIKDSYFTSWNKGADPNILSVIELADILSCSIDHLIGRS